jgi:tRNA-2-methylthio-N6-dimethylallyladenosine synthase
MTDALIDAMAAAAPKVCPYLHLPVQSGSDAVLEAMRRGYSRARYLGRIDRLRRSVPGIAFGTDVIVGFPAETDADFDATIGLLEEVEFDTVYSFAYSPRPGTRALGLGDPIPQGVKFERLGRLQARQKEIQERRSRAWVGRVVEALVDGPSKRGGMWTGRTLHNRIVHFPPGTARPGTLRRVEVADATAFSLRGRLV